MRLYINKLSFLYKITFFCIILFPGCFSFAQTNEPKLISSLDKAGVIVDGRRLFLVRGISSFPAKERAKLIDKNIEEIANDDSLSPDSIKIVHNETFEEIALRGNIIMRVVDADAELEGINREIMASVIKDKIIDAIISYRNEREPEVLLSKTFYAVVATAIMILILFLFFWIMKKIDLTLQQKLKPKISTVEKRSFKIIKSNQLWVMIHGLIGGFKLIIVVLLLFAYLQYVLELYPWSRYISVRLVNLFLIPLGAIGTAIINFIPNLAFLIIIYFITKYLLKVIKIFFDGLNKQSITISGFEAEWAYPTFKIVRIFFIIFAVVIAYPYIPGSDSVAFKGISIFIGLLFSLSSSSIVGNITAGYTMIYRRTFKTGDIVKIDDHIGQVIDIKQLVTKIKTFRNEEIIVPNSLVLKSNITNYSTPLKTHDAIILYTTVGIGYETPWRQVEGMLLLAAERTEGLLKEPKPFIWQRSLGDFAVSYELNVFYNDPINMMKHYTNLHRNILDIFNENNVQIMTPAYVLDPEQPKVVPKGQWFTPIVGKVENKKNANV